MKKLLLTDHEAWSREVDKAAMWVTDEHLPEKPAAFPCVMLWRIVHVGSTSFGYLVYGYVYPEDFGDKT